MIVTKKFVVINLPKTGSTFVRKCISQASQVSSRSNALSRLAVRIQRKFFPSYRTLLFPEVTDSKSIRYNQLTEHGKVFQIPSKHRRKQIVSVYRNHYERYVSLFEYRDWIKAPWLPNEILKGKFPHYPDISFSEYVDLMLTNSPFADDSYLKQDYGLGPLSIQFVMFYSKSPFKMFSGDLTRDQFLSSIKEDLKSISFLKFESLNQSLYTFLLNHDYSQKSIHFILESEKINQSVKNTKKHMDYFNSELLNRIDEREWLFRELDLIK